MLDIIDKKIVAAMQAEFPLEPEPYRKLAEQLGIGEEELLSRLESYMKSGIIRKMGAVLRHRRVGFTANALCAWLVPEERVEETGRLMAEHSAVTHCYSRSPQPDWPYNLYTMIHTQSRESCRELAGYLARIASVHDYLLLFSVKEWKKTSMRYFREVEKHD